MKKQIALRVILPIIAISSLFFAVAPTPVYADHCDPETQVTISIGIDDGDGNTVHCIDKNEDSTDPADNPIFIYLRGVIRFMAVGVGLAITIAIVVAGIQYTSSRDNPQAVQAATKKLTNAIIALITFIFMTAILNFLVPGGLV